MSVPVLVVALRKESVDRNGLTDNGGLLGTGSLSARRAWIEIAILNSSHTGNLSLSARRAWIEIVGYKLSIILPSSLSARRAWIEMYTLPLTRTGYVSLSARRAWIEISYNRI